MRTPCHTCCMGRRRGCGAIRHIAGKPRCCANTRRTLRTSPTSATATKTASTRSNEQEPHQVAGALESGTRVRGDEAEVWIRKSTLSRTGQECQPSVRDLRPGESVSGPQAIPLHDGGIVSTEAAQRLRGGARQTGLPSRENQHTSPPRVPTPSLVERDACSEVP